MSRTLQLRWLHSPTVGLRRLGMLLLCLSLLGLPPLPGSPLLSAALAGAQPATSVEAGSEESPCHSNRASDPQAQTDVEAQAPMQDCSCCPDICACGPAARCDRMAQPMAPPVLFVAVMGTVSVGPGCVASRRLPSRPPEQGLRPPSERADLCFRIASGVTVS